MSTEAWDPPELDAAVSEALLDRVDRGELGGHLRLFVPKRAVVFGRQDRARPGFSEAADAARDAGFAPVLRLAGGRAAVFHERTIALALAVPDPTPREEIRRRFEEVSAAIASALAALGVDARVGEVEGEYCPGSYSVNAGGARKLAGIGQRLRRRAAHVGGVIVVDGADTVNRVLGPVYRALEYPVDLRVTGAVSDHANVGVEETLAALIKAFGSMAGELVPAPIDEGTLALARSLAADGGAGVA
jgi:octanoyl-[GcvH]:protein N-octanoyltransferase